MQCKRYFPPELWSEFQNKIATHVELQTIGYSVLGRPIVALKLGAGSKKILMWSQMHGNETTTTKALIDFIPWFLESNQKELQNKLTLFIVPQLNPDGAKAYSRLNANSIDLNRDAAFLSQPESIALRKLFNSFSPDYCLNLHGQRTIYAAGINGPSASISFLAPAANEDRSITSARKIAMQHIAALVNELKPFVSHGIGRYDDTFNSNCVGDTFTKLGIPTILFEAGHVPGDYQREISKKYILKAYKIFCQNCVNQTFYSSYEDYFDIPENKAEFVDIVVSGVRIKNNNKILENQFLAIQFEETLKNDSIHFIPVMHSFRSSPTQRAHRNVSNPSGQSKLIIEFKAEKSLNQDQIDILFPENQ